MMIQSLRGVVERVMAAVGQRLQSPTVGVSRWAEAPPIGVKDQRRARSWIGKREEAHGGWVRWR